MNSSDSSVDVLRAELLTVGQSLIDALAIEVHFCKTANVSDAERLNRFLAARGNVNRLTAAYRRAVAQYMAALQAAAHST